MDFLHIQNLFLTFTPHILSPFKTMTAFSFVSRKATAFFSLKVILFIFTLPGNNVIFSPFFFLYSPFFPFCSLSERALEG